MVAISGIEALAPPVAQNREQKTAAPVEYGAAVTHRDDVRQPQRVDPAARSDRTRGADRLRGRDPRKDGRRESGEDDASGEAPQPGRLVDITV